DRPDRLIPARTRFRPGHRALIDRRGELEAAGDSPAMFRADSVEEPCPGIGERLERRDQLLHLALPPAGLPHRRRLARGVARSSRARTELGDELAMLRQLSDQGLGAAQPLTVARDLLRAHGPETIGLLLEIGEGLKGREPQHVLLLAHGLGLLRLRARSL